MARYPLAVTSLFARLSTSIKMLAVLTLALMPLGIIALLASLSANRATDEAHRADLRVALNEGTRKLDNELKSDMIVLTEAAHAVEVAPWQNDPCRRLLTIVGQRTSRQVSLALFGAAGGLVCATPGTSIARPSTVFNDRPQFTIEDDALTVIVPVAGGSAAVARYPAATLAAFAQPSGYNAAYRLTLENGSFALPLVDQSAGGALDRSESMSAPVGIDGLALRMDTEYSPFSAADAILTFLPLLMWASAALVGFYVVDRLLIRPLESLRAAVARYVPGTPLPRVAAATPAIEIRELGQTFRQFADRLAERERELKDALAHQVTLTREVHHRVKNNLQVIGSLINLHARGVTTEDGQTAYLTIQRRVDALSIVHRNHYAEFDDQGINVRTLLGELASNFRGSVASASRSPTITLTAASLLVSQDIAMPLAFLFTELAELSLDSDPNASVLVDVDADTSDALNAPVSKGVLTIRSRAFVGTSAAAMSATAGRVVTGLARQLRASLDHDTAQGTYRIVFPASAVATD